LTTQDGEIVELDASFDSSQPFPWVPGAFKADENWAALVDKDGYGMGVVNFDTTNFIGGFSGEKGSGDMYENFPLGTSRRCWTSQYQHKGLITSRSI